MISTTPIEKQEFSKLPTDEGISRVAKALENNGFRVILAENGEEAKNIFAEIVPAGTEVFTASSTTLKQIGLAQEIDQPDGRYNSVRIKLATMDAKTQNREMQKLGATPEFVVGSVHAITEGGTVLVASASGSQLAPYVASAEKVVWVVGAQKIVPTFEDAMRRIEEYTLPLEDERMMAARGVHSSLNKILFFRKERAGRITIILIKEVLGF